LERSRFCFTVDNSVEIFFEAARARIILHGAIIEIDDGSGRVLKIERIAEII
jgi:calcineurin-like phosphoesterase